MEHFYVFFLFVYFISHYYRRMLKFILSIHTILFLISIDITIKDGTIYARKSGKHYKNTSR